MGKVASCLARVRTTHCIIRGLKQCGFEVAEVPKEKPNEDDVLVLWNRLHTTDPHARRYEAAGAKVIICENGWIEGTIDSVHNPHTYAICLNQHNGAGWWPVGKRSRWPNFGIEVKPYRTKGEHILVVPQRGMGIPPVGQPRDWCEDVTTRLAQTTDRPIMVKHPSTRSEPLDPLWVDCHAVVIWSSGAGIKSIVNGIPVFYEMPMWIGSPAAEYGIEDLEYPNTNEGLREYMLHRLSWALWTADEVERGEAFRWLLRL